MSSKIVTIILTLIILFSPSFVFAQEENISGIINEQIINPAKEKYEDLQVKIDETPDYIKEQAKEEIKEKQRTWTRAIWVKIKEKFVSGVKDLVNNMKNRLDNKVINPLKLKLEEGTTALRNGVVSIKNVFIGFLRKIGLYSEESRE